MLQDAFTRLNNAAKLTKREPTPVEKETGKYRKGIAQLFPGVMVAFENERGSVRTGAGEGGKQYRNLMPDHYGEILGTVGADGDPIDVWVGPWPESRRIFIVNSLCVSGSRKGMFDEHKVMACYPDARMARQAYENAYDRDFPGFGDMVEMTLSEFMWWLRHGAKTVPVSLDLLPRDGLEPAMQTNNVKAPLLDSLVPYTQWNTEAQPRAMTLDSLLYQIRRSDADDGLMLDCATMAELVEGYDSVAMDAMVVQVSTLSLKMEAMRKVMDMAGNAVKTVSVQMSDPVKKAGSTNVAVLFELTDGQTVTVWFHNPDMTPAKLAPTDDLISWKWLLNKKDVTIVVAPEHGKDLNVREVSRRIMKLAEKNSAAFKKANATRAGKLAEVESLKGQIVVAEKRLEELQGMKARRDMEAEDKAMKFDPLSVTGYEEVLKDPALQLKYQDQLDAKFQERIVEIRNALRGLGWTAESFSKPMFKDGSRLEFEFPKVGSGRNVVGITVLTKDAKGFTAEVVDNLAQTPEEFADFVNVMTAGKSAAEPVPDKVVAMYSTKGGRVAVQVKKHTAGNGAVSYSYLGLYGAGSTRNIEDIVAALQSMKAAHPGMVLTSGQDLLAAATPVAATPAAEPAKLSLTEWEAEVIRILEEGDDGMTTSDAQGVYGAREGDMESLYVGGYTPQEAANTLLGQDGGVNVATSYAAEPAPAATPVASNQGPLPWDGVDVSVAEETRWFGTQLNLTAVDRNLGAKGLVKEGAATLFNVIGKGGKALSVQWADQTSPVRITASQYVIEVTRLQDANKAPDIPDDVRSGVGAKALAAWNKGLTEGETHSQKFGMAMFAMLMDGLGFRGYQSVSSAFSRINDELMGGAFPAGLTFADGVKRIRKISSDIALELASITPVEPKRTPMSEGQANGASLKVGDQLDDLKRSAAFGMVQIDNALFITPDRALEVAYDGAKKALEAARQEYFDLATKFEKDAASEADQEKQDEYTPFDASKVKLPTAVQLGSNKSNMFSIFQGVPGAWSNGHILDVATPGFIQKAIDSFAGDNTRLLRHLSHQAFENVMTKAKASTTKVEPIAFNDGFAIGPVTTGKKSMEKTPANSVVLADESRSFSVAVDQKYFGYFFKTYKGCEFFADEKGGAVLVKKGGVAIGLIMPRTVHKSAEMLRYAKGAQNKAAEAAAQAEADANDPSVKLVDDAYRFDDATVEFKKEIADSVSKADYSPFLSAKTLDMAAKAHGMTVSWSVQADEPAMDSIGEGEVVAADADGDGEAGEGGEEGTFDAAAEFEAMPAME